ncbi:unnamed protein product [Victoria cruziana]
MSMNSHSILNESFPTYAFQLHTIVQPVYGYRIMFFITKASRLILQICDSNQCHMGVHAVRVGTSPSQHGASKEA